MYLRVYVHILIEFITASCCCVKVVIQPKIFASMNIHWFFLIWTKVLILTCRWDQCLLFALMRGYLFRYIIKMKRMLSIQITFGCFLPAIQEVYYCFFKLLADFYLLWSFVPPLPLPTKAKVGFSLIFIEKGVKLFLENTWGG